MRTDVRADIVDGLAGLDQSRKGLALQLRELAITVEGPADELVARVVQHPAVAAVLQPQMALLDDRVRAGRHRKAGTSALARERQPIAHGEENRIDPGIVADLEVERA